MSSLLIFLILSIASVLYLKIADKFNIIDKPNQRSSHTVPTIRGGGILFVIAYLCYEISFNLPSPYLLISVLMISVVCFIDDVKTLSSKLRFPFQILSVVIVSYQAGLFEYPLFIPVFFIISGTAFLNFYNFMDGINGITGFYSIVVLLGLCLVDQRLNILPKELIYYEFLAVLIFGYFNFRKKARFFSGDIGSVSMALILSYLFVLIFKAYKSPISILLLIVYGTDTVMTVLYRFFIKEKITEAHRHHIYQKLVDRTTLTHLQVSTIYSSIQLIVTLIVYLMLDFSLMVQTYFTFLTILLFITGYYILFLKLNKLIK